MTKALDEISELELDLQSKLLKAIEEKRIRRLGSERELAIDVQIITATNRDLETWVQEGQFRADLYHRLSLLQLALPALRHRKDDIRELLPVFVEEFNATADKAVKVVPEAVWHRLASYHWPGHVRALHECLPTLHL